jgi:hypothetical protein
VEKVSSKMAQKHSFLPSWRATWPGGILILENAALKPDFSARTIQNAKRAKAYEICGLGVTLRFCE